MNIRESHAIDTIISNEQADNITGEQISVESVATPAWLENFLDIYQQLGVDNLDRLEQIYDTHIRFSDPLHSVNGIENLLEYFQHLYANLNYCHFTVFDHICDGNRAAIFWQMDFSHPKLNGGKNVCVAGSSKLSSDGHKVTSHQDYFDAGAMLYENISVLGTVVRYAKRRAAKVEID